MNDAEVAGPPGHRWPVLTPIVILLATLASFFFALNWTSPWESDQPAKAAQILEIVDSNDYFFSSQLKNYYRIRQLPLYYFFSSLAYKLTGGPIITFMNLTSVVMGTMTILATAYALRNALGIHPFWTAFVLLAMPLVITNSTYGNEAAFSLFFLSLAMLLATSGSMWLYYASAVAFACAIFARIDMVVVIPYWGLWALIFGPAYENRGALVRRGAMLGAVLAAACAALWLLLVRENSLVSPKFTDWETNLLLVAAYLSYPFNPSVVLLAAIGWLLLCKNKRSYAAVHLLLLVPIVFYAQNLASPKYVIVLTLFYAIPAAYLFARTTIPIRTAGVAAVLVWFVFGISNFGIFGPRQAALWYVPTMDGAIPSGGYINFYGLARQGFYQAKQNESVAVAKNLLASFETLGPDVRLGGDFPWISLAINRVERRRAGKDPFVPEPAIAKTGDTKFVMVSWGVVGIDRSVVDLKGKVLKFLEQGQIRPLPPTENAAFPDVVEVGEQVPAGTNIELGKRFLFMHKYYHGYRAFHLPSFIEPYAATSWFPVNKVPQIAGLPTPIYEDDHYVAFDVDVPGAEYLGLQWPARYHQFERVTPVR